MSISSNATGLKPGVCTSSTRPTTPYEGQVIYETDTDKTLVWNGSAWVGLRTNNLQSYSSGTYTGGGFAEAALYGKGGGNYPMSLALDATGSGDNIARVRILNNSTASWQFNFDSTTGIDVYGTPAWTRKLLLTPDGYLHLPRNPRFLVYKSGLSKAANSWEDISALGGDTNRVVSYNVGNHWNTTTGLFTAPVDGYYLFYAGGWANYNGAGNRYAISFHINAAVGGDWLYISGANTSAVDSPLAMGPVVRYMAAGWYMRTAMYSSVAMTLGTTSHKFYYGGHLLG